MHGYLPLKNSLLVVLVLFVGVCHGQAPSINNVDPVSTFPEMSVVITGSGFNTTAGQNQVWFGSVKGTVTSATAFSIVATVPAEAKLESVEVLNLGTKLSAKSPLKFIPSFSGEGFDPAKLSAPLSFTSTTSLFDVTSCDLDGDGLPDLIGTKFEDPSTDLIILKDQSTPESHAFTKFDKTNLAALDLSAPTFYVTTGDLDGDGKPDIVASRSGSTANSIFILRNTSTPGTLGFAAKVELFMDVGHFARRVTIHDLNGDGKPEIIVSNSFNNELYVFLNQSSGSLSINPTPMKVTVTGATNTFGLVVADMDGDLKPDIVVNQFQGNDIFILRNQSGGSISFAAASKITLSGTLHSIIAADFNGDGMQDLAVTNTFSAQAFVLINQSTSTSYSFKTPITLAAENGSFGIETGDLDGDGDVDLAVANRNVSTLDVYLNDGNASPAFTKKTITTSHPNWNISIDDFDGDAKPDIAVTVFDNGTSSYAIDILRNKNCYMPAILNDSPLSICAGQTFTLNTPPSPAATFDWKLNGGTVKNNTEPFLDITAGGNYTVTATTESGACALTTAVFAVTDGTGSAPADPTISAVTPVCAGDNISLMTPAVAGATYAWTGPSGFNSSQQNPVVNTITASNAGTYALQVTVGDCSSHEVTKNVDVISLANFSISSSVAGATICEGDNLTLSVNAQAGNTYQWILDGSDLSGKTSSTLSVTQEGTYSMRVTNTGLGCSTTTNSIDAKILTAPAADYSVAASACLGSAVSFTDQSSIDNRATIEYAWDFGDSGTSAAVSPTHTYASAGDFNVSLIVSYTGFTCSSAKAASLTVNDPILPILAAADTAICSGDNDLLMVENDSSFQQITWNTTETGATIEVTDPGTYSINTTDVNGCPGTGQVVIIEAPGCQQTATITPPPAFSPNADGMNDTWVIPQADSLTNCVLSLFDIRGRRVYETKEFPLTGWDGTAADGSPLPMGTYYYVIGCPAKEPVTGSVLILR